MRRFVIMKYLMKKKSLLPIILILVLAIILCACSGSSPLAKDEDALVGYWESAMKDQADGTPIFSMTFNKDGTGVFDFWGEFNITDYACEDGTLHMDFDNGAVIKFKYRFNDDKSSLYLMDDENSEEIKYNRADKSNDDTSAKSNSENSNSDSEQPDDNSTSEYYNEYDSEYEDAQSALNLQGIWKSEEVLEDGLPAYSLELNIDGASSFVDPNYVYDLQDYYVENGTLYLVDTDGGILEIFFAFNSDYTELNIEYT